MPLAPLGGDKDRPGLINVPFQTYMKLDTPPEGARRRIMTFTRAARPAPTRRRTRPRSPTRPSSSGPGTADACTCSPARSTRTGTSGPRRPVTSSFWQEFLKYSVANPDRHTLRVGEAVEEFFPASAAGLTAGLSGPEGLAANLPLVLAGRGRRRPVQRHIVQRAVPDGPERLPRPGVRGERRRRSCPARRPSPTCRRIDSAEFKAVGPAVQVVTDPTDVKPTGESGAVITTAPKPHGPMLARLAVLLAVLVLVTELVLAWRLGPSGTGRHRRCLEGRRAADRAPGRHRGGAPAAGRRGVRAVRRRPRGAHRQPARVPARTASGRASRPPPACRPRRPARGPSGGSKAFTAFFRNAVTDRRAVAGLAAGVRRARGRRLLDGAPGRRRVRARRRAGAAPLGHVPARPVRDARRNCGSPSTARAGPKSSS